MTTDSDDIKGLEERLRKAAHAATPSDIRNPRDWFFMRGRDQLFWDAANPKDLIDILDAKDDALRTAIAQLEEARARLADLVKPEESREWLPTKTIDRLQAREEAAEARLEEAKAVLDRGARLALAAENFCLRFTINDLPEMDDQQRNAVLDQIKLFREGSRAFLHHGGEDAR